MRTHPERFTQEPHGAGRERSEERGREHGRLGESALLVMRSTSVITAKPKVRQPHTGRGARNISAEPPIIRREACRACALYTRSTRRKKTIDECGTTPPLLGRCARREARRANERHIESGLTREEIAALRRGLCGPHRYCPIHPRASLDIHGPTLWTPPPRLRGHWAALRGSPARGEASPGSARPRDPARVHRQHGRRGGSSLSRTCRQHAPTAWKGPAMRPEWGRTSWERRLSKKQRPLLGKP
ncbi:unnamed protein product [Prorocentrum cordatum]|uniref:Uncharacterized protein n=1 Tax=Prorocentrum cordatum TaxID=2364126 RepID=A0ABN9W6L0_9DINO|nr:unnamed protein product [Polarella glacialis]